MQLYTIEDTETRFMVDIEASKLISDKLYEQIDNCTYIESTNSIDTDAKTVKLKREFNMPCNTVVPGWNDLETWCRKNHRLDILQAFINGRNEKSPSNIPFRQYKPYNWKCNNLLDDKTLCGYEWTTSPSSIVKTKNSTTMCPACRARSGKSTTLVTGVNDLETYCNNKGLIDLLQDYILGNNLKVPSKISATSHEDVNWCCTACGYKWNTKLSYRTHSGNGCPKCTAMSGRGTTVVRGVNDLFTWAKSNNRADIIECWSETNEYNINDISCKTDQYDVYLNCKMCSREIKTKPYLITRSVQSTLCNHCKMTGTSIPQIILHKLLENRFGDNVEYRKRIGKHFELDEYIPYLNLGIEYNGGYHLTPYGIKTDAAKKSLCRNLNINLLVIQECKDRDKVDIIYNNMIIIYYKYNKSIETFQAILDFISDKAGVKLSHITEQEFKCALDTAIKGCQRVQAINNITITNPGICKDWDYDANDGLKPEQFTRGSSQKVYWVCNDCPETHSYIMSIAKRCLDGQSCSNRPNRIVSSGVNDLATLKPDILKFWDYEKNEFELIYPNKVTLTGRQKVYWKCPVCHSECYETVVEMVKRNKCIKCGEVISK